MRRSEFQHRVRVADSKCLTRIFADFLRNSDPFYYGRQSPLCYWNYLCIAAAAIAATTTAVVALLVEHGINSITFCVDTLNWKKICRQFFIDTVNHLDTLLIDIRCRLDTTQHATQITLAFAKLKEDSIFQRQLIQLLRKFTRF